MIVEILPIAQDDVDQALIYIATDDPAAADRLYNDILEKLNQVSQLPYSAPEIMIGRRVYRKVYVHPYNLYSFLMMFVLITMVLAGIFSSLGDTPFADTCTVSSIRKRMLSTPLCR